jgi:sRNA-binding carbon storage regulator CsrA
MPLVLSLRTGQDFYVGDVQVVVGEILGKSRLKVRVPKSGRVYEISDEEAVELREKPDVFLSAGDRATTGVARVAIDAPREVTILRGESYRSG